MAGKPSRIFSPEFKEAVVLRMVAGERVYALADELKIKAQVLYRWWSNYDQHGVAALRTGRRRRGVVAPIALPPAIRSRSTRGRPRQLAPDAAAKRIAELERKVGEQALEIDFFERALRQLKAARVPSDRRGAGPSSPSSRR